MSGSLASANARTLLRILALALGLAATCAQAQAQVPSSSSVPGPVLEMIAAWQNSTRAPTPEAKIAEIEKALKIARSFDRWPLRSPERDELLGQMWGQLGNEYRRVRSNARSEALEKAIAAYTQALNHFNMQRYPDGWGRVQYGLGAAYLDRARGDRAENIEQAIANLSRCATVLTREKAPAMWADAQTVLSTAFWHRVRGNRADNLEQALDAARNALTVLTRDKQPSDWASAQAALGAAYWARIRGDRADNVETAIAAYEQALEVMPRDKDPRTWAGLQDNLGMALAARLRGNRVENLKAALAAFTRAEQVFTRNAHPSEWGQLQMNIANTALEFEVGGAARRGNVETALKAYGNALTVYNRQATPERWARIMLNVGSAYLDRREGARAENIEKAVEALTQSLTVYTPALDPNKWAIAQGNVGSAYRQRVRGDRDRNLELASKAFDAALTVHTLSAAPMQHMLAAHAAGEVAALRRDWRGAKAHLASAIAASTILFGEGLNRSEAERVVQAGGRLYASAAYVAAELGDASLALDTLEAGRARLLRTALGLDALAMPEADRKRLAELRAAVPDLEVGLLTATGDERLTILNTLAERRKAIELTIKARLDTNDGDPLHATGTALASSLLQSHSAIVAPIVTELGTKLLMVIGSDGEPKINIVPLTRLTEDGLLKFLRGEAERDELGGWLAAYAGLVRRSADLRAERRFLNAVRDLGPQLGDMLGAELAAALDKAGVGRDASIVWLPNGALGLLPLGLSRAAPGEAPLLDRYTLVVTPSLAVLESSRRRARASRVSASLAGIINPTRDLAFTELEGAAAASYFRPHARMLLADDAQPGAVLAALKGTGYWHFATHGTFSWSNPRASALVLAHKKLLTVGDLLEQIDLSHPRLVLLSACETGLYDFQRAPDEFIGLPSAFLQVGAMGVIGTLWPVNDVSTSLVMMKFYELHRLGDVEPAQALRRAQLWLRDAKKAELDAFVAEMRSNARLTGEQAAAMAAAIDGSARASGAQPFNHPYHWAAFLYFGA